MGKLRLRKIIQLASKVKQPGFEPKSVRHPQPLSTSVSHTLLPRQQAQKPGRQLGPRVGVRQFKESPKITRHDSYCLFIQDCIWKDQIDENCKEQ